MSEPIQKIGNWNQKGLLNSFKKKGITYFSSISEYIANSIDADATEISLMFKKNEFLIIDNGNGMNHDQISNMFSNYRSNHTTDKSIGSVGIGAKLGNAFISKYKNTSTILTKSNEGDYLKVTIPWGEIYKSGIYEDKVQLCIMSGREKEIFHKTMLDCIPNCTNFQGTLISHKFSKANDTELYEMVTKQFDRSKLKSELHNKQKRWDCMFTHPNLEIHLYDKSSSPHIQKNIERYHHMNPDLTYYFDSIKSYEIRVFQDDESNNIFIVEFEGQDYIIKKSGRGFSKDVSKFIRSEYRNFKDTHDRINYKVGAEVNESYFNPNQPQNYTKSDLHKSMLSPYDTQFFGNSKDQRIDCSKTSLIRNGQQISSINLPQHSFSQQDGGEGTEKKTFGIVITSDMINYYTVSDQDNILDEVFGIQEIKDNVEEKKIRVDLLRLLSFLRVKYTEDIFQKILDLINTIPNPELDESETESETESESEDEGNSTATLTQELESDAEESSVYTDAEADSEDESNSETESVENTEHNQILLDNLVDSDNDNTVSQIEENTLPRNRIQFYIGQIEEIIELMNSEELLDQETSMSFTQLLNQIR
jgi:hypothetical protein